ncbi:MAG: ABC transporter permease [Deltaproteobacteria bacterium]|jgi:ABC-type lipoprotein release transport system permease subunit|nr:ABC transporter permease [Deltaproteobacteria bacterium]MBW2475836.1 ABC transporter permease [Deltaproteobacteria bacterium]
MEKVSLAWRNLWRNRRRTIITLAAISFSIMLVQAFHNLSFGVYESMVDSGVRAGSGHIAIYHTGYLNTRDESLSFPVASLPEVIEQIPGVVQALPRIYLPALAQTSRESRGVVLIGVEPKKERLTNPFLQNLSDQSMIRKSNSRDAIIGQRLLQELQIKPGQKFVVTAQHRDGSLHSELLRVRGIINTGMKDIDSSLILIGSQRAAMLSGHIGNVHELAIVLKSAWLDRQVFPEIAKRLVNHPNVEAVNWEQAMPNLANAIKLDYASQKFIFLIILLIVTIGVINTMLMSVMERMREFGVILALGSTPVKLGGLILLEALILGCIAALLGSFLGCLATWYLATVGIDLETFMPETLEFGGVVFDTVLRANWDIAWMAQIAIYVIGLTVFAALYPAVKAGRISPMEGMRHT